MRTTLLLTLSAIAACAAPPSQESEAHAASEDDVQADPAYQVDPSDPTKIDARVGLGYKFTDLPGGVTMNEGRTKVALDAGPEGTFVMDIGLGRLDGFPPDDDVGLTDGRFRYFRLLEIDRGASGYQGWGASLEVQTQGSVPGTDGSNLGAVGALAALGWGRQVALYPNLILSGLWANDLDGYLGTAIRGDLNFAYRPDGLWTGAYWKLKPSYSYGFTDAIAGEASFDVETAIGGTFSAAKTWWWEVNVRTFLQDDLQLDTIGSNERLAPDWSLFLSVTRFF